MKKINKCKFCNSDPSYSDEWDAKYCEKCDMWLEDICGCKPEDNDGEIINCYFECWKRPEKPNEKSSQM